MPQSNRPPVRRHLIIAGTGRAGTTFLVRYLTALGLDTHLSRRGEAAWLDEEAQAGLEDFPFGPDSNELPYVIKNPMLFEFIDQVLADEAIAVDGVIIPMRDLNEATESRVILERRSMYEHLPWLGYMDKPWESAGNVPGGIIHSLNALDEARLLATGFHLLVERLVRANVPFVFLDFPRIVNDADYLYEKLAALVPNLPEREAARDIHAGIANPALVRVTADKPAPDERLDGIALRRELVRLRVALAAMTAERDDVSRALENTHRELVRTQAAYVAAEPAAQLVEQQRSVLDALVREADQLRAQVMDLEKLRQRAWNDAAALQIDLERSAQQLQTLAPQNELLKSRNILLAAQMEVVMSERGALEAYCHRLEHTAADARARAIAAERTMHEYLAAFVDDAGSLLTPPERGQLLLKMRARVASLIKQLDITQQDLTATMAHLERREAETPPVLARIRRSLRRTASG